MMTMINRTMMRIIPIRIVKTIMHIVVPRLETAPIIPIVAMMMPMIIVSEIMTVISPIRMIESVVSPRTHPRIVIIIVPIVIVVIDSEFRAIFEIDIQITIFGDMRGKIGIVETTDTFAILKFLIFFGTDGNRIYRCNSKFIDGRRATTIVFIHIARRR